MYAKERVEVLEEPCIQISEELQKPDLVTIEYDRVCVIHSQIVSGQ